MEDAKSYSAASRVGSCGRTEPHNRPAAAPIELVAVVALVVAACDVDHSFARATEVQLADTLERLPIDSVEGKVGAYWARLGIEGNFGVHAR